MAAQPPTFEVMSNENAIAVIGPGGTMIVGQNALADFIDLLIALKDVAERPADDEENGLEDSFQHHAYGYGAGCPVADPDAGVDDERHDNDDPAEEDDPLELNGDEHDVSYRNDTRGNLHAGDNEDDETTGAEDDFMRHRHANGPECPIADPDRGADDEGEPEHEL